ncbi:MAG: coproporphyrinogen III oxidase [Acidimicrobiia bacterium]|nr:MAG: coproporphyrinogen III oxidase [Acidimicrobiia bacterium]
MYVHVPFCAHRCDYCDFATWTDRAHLMHDYTDACVRDLAARRAEGHPPATSVFFGGGTPSLLPAGELVRVLDAIERAPGAEVTVECNPDSVDAAKLRAYAAAGVNRLSFGAQSFSPHVLRALGRTHDPANVARAVALARDAGITDLNVDCIYGTPGETLDDWRRTLDAVVGLGVPHVSVYALTVEPGTPLGRRVAAGAVPAPDDDDQADGYLLADEVLGAAGYEWYEISNFARPGAQCRHNRCYWEQGEYLGIGCAAHGHTGGRRWWNVRTPERYVARVAAGRSPEAGHERLDGAARAEEALQLALRTRRGAGVAGPAVEELRAAGLLEPGPGPAVLTRRGRLLASEVTARLALALAAGTARAGGAGVRVP